jgi:high-affinity K+ transport system ATPase subunit B
MTSERIILQAIIFFVLLLLVLVPLALAERSARQAARASAS